MQTDVSINPMLQLMLTALLPWIMQGLKKVNWVDLNKAWFCPLVCVVASVVCARLLNLENWFVIGLTGGIASAKVYDFAHDGAKDTGISPTINKPLAILLILMLPAVMLAGCNLELSSSEKAEFTAIVAQTHTDNTKCQEGDPNYCIKTFADVNDTLTYAVNNASMSKGYGDQIKQRRTDARIFYGHYKAHPNDPNIKADAQLMTDIAYNVLAGANDSNSVRK